MTQDLIEIATSLTINGCMSDWLIKLCRLSLLEEEQLLTETFDLFCKPVMLETEQFGINSMFTMNKTSRLYIMLKDLKNK